MEPATSAERDDRLQAQDGDVLITRETNSGGNYSVRQLPGRAQFTAATRDEAIRLARDFAVNQSVNLWSRDGDGYELLEHHRPAKTSTTFDS
jgi:hypothetical protein